MYPEPAVVAALGARPARTSIAQRGCGRTGEGMVGHPPRPCSADRSGFAPGRKRRAVPLADWSEPFLPDQ